MDELKVFLNGEWEKFEIILKQPHPDGGVCVESKRLQERCARNIHDVVDLLIVVHDDDGAALLCFADMAEGHINGSFLSQLSQDELHTYLILEV